MDKYPKRISDNGGSIFSDSVHDFSLFSTNQTAENAFLGSCEKNIFKESIILI